MSHIYQKGEILGVGPFATVYTGWDQLLDREVAIKELNQPYAGDEGFVRSFVGRSLEMLDVAHEQVLATYAADSSHHPPAMVRELADQTLETLVIANPLPPAEVEEILRRTLAGLGALHTRALFHGAVKPQNLFRSGEGYKIGDFGIPVTPGGCGIPPRERRYTAPEVLRDEPCGAAADIYSLGLVAYELLLGQLPFERLGEELARQAGLEPEGGRRSARDEVWAVVNASPIEIPPPHELAAGLPMALSLTIHQMTRKDLVERLSATQAVLASLGAPRPSVEARAPAPAPAARPRPGAAARPAGGTGPAGAASPRAMADREDGRSPAVRPRGPARTGGGSLRKTPWRLVYIGGGGLAAVTLTGLGWLLASRGPFSGRLPAAAPAAALAPAPVPCPPRGIDEASDAAALARALYAPGLAGSGLDIDFDPPRAGTPASLSLGTPLRFRLTSDAPGHFLLFVLASDGSLTRFYPSSWQPDLALTSPRGGSLVLPSDAERRAGFLLKATRPLGRDAVFVLRSALPLSPPELGRLASVWTRDYILADGTAGAFVAWVARLRCEHPADVKLAMREVDVVAAP